MRICDSCINYNCAWRSLNTIICPMKTEKEEKVEIVRLKNKKHCLIIQANIALPTESYKNIQQELIKQINEGVCIIPNGFEVVTVEETDTEETE